MEPEGLHSSGCVSKGRSAADGEALMGRSASELEKIFMVMGICYSLRMNGKRGGINSYKRFSLVLKLKTWSTTPWCVRGAEYIMSTTDVFAGTCMANESILSFWGNIAGRPLALTYFRTLCGNDNTHTQAVSPLQTFLAINIPPNPLVKTKRQWWGW